MARHIGSHVLKVKSPLVQPCVNLNTTHCPVKGLHQVNFYALVSAVGSMTIGSMVALAKQVHTRVTKTTNIPSNFILQGTKASR